VSINYSVWKVRWSPASVIGCPWSARRSRSQTVNIRRTRVLLRRTIQLGTLFL